MSENRVNVGRINGVDIYAVSDESGNVYVPVKPICKALGVNADSQVDKINEHNILASTTVLRGVVAADGRQREMICIPLKYTFGWLFTINPDNVSEVARENVIKYQKECYEVLYRHFAGKLSREQQFIDVERNLLKREREILDNLEANARLSRELKREHEDIRRQYDRIRDERLNPTPGLFD
ncbi:MAG: phage antirepressor N-terminal domain-containing protein [Muribaculaceae bacterium]|nr:phage antirepressor N-terminal domain-containing protein [Muribaculaceae bacterium]